MNPTLTIDTKITLTIQGQAFQMTMEELRALHEEIGKAITPKIVHVPYERPRDRIWMQTLPPIIHHPAPYLDPTTRPMCETGTPMEYNLTSP